MGLLEDRKAFRTCFKIKVCQLKDIEWFLTVVSKGEKTVQWIRKENTNEKDQSKFIIKKNKLCCYIISTIVCLNAALQIKFTKCTFSKHVSPSVYFTILRRGNVIFSCFCSKHRSYP